MNNKASAKLAALLLAACGGFGLSGMAAEPPEEAAGTLEGELGDGTPYRVDVPGDWNGVLLLDLDYVSRSSGEDPTSDSLLRRGYALAGTSRRVTGWAVHESVDNLAEVRELAVVEFGEPKWTVAYGRSLGGHTALAATQTYPERLDGGISLCSSPAGAIGVWNGKLDALFVARTLLAPESGLPIMEVPETFREVALPAWQKMLADAQETSEGRARVALAAVLGQLPEWANAERPEPEADDLEARQQGLYDSLAGGRLPVIGQAMSSRHQVRTLAGGHISWNTGFDYRAALKLLESRRLVAALYEKAGLDLEADLGALARATRIVADPQAIERMKPHVFSGALEMPILTLHATGDHIAPVAATQALTASVQAAGRGELLRQVYTKAPGHCPFSTSETVAAVEVMHERLESGQWPDVSASAMNARADGPGDEARYIDYRPEPFLRPFDRRDMAAGRINGHTATTERNRQPEDSRR